MAEASACRGTGCAARKQCDTSRDGHGPSHAKRRDPVPRFVTGATLENIAGPDHQAHVLAEVAHVPWAPERAPVYHGAMKSLVTPQWHYVVHEKLGIEIYDWQKDPRTSRNLATIPEMQIPIAQLTSRLQHILSIPKSEKPSRTTLTT